MTGPNGIRARRAGIIETLLQDVRYALRKLRRAPGFTAVAALTVAIGVSAATTIFSVANEVLFEPPPGVKKPRELVTLHRIDDDGSSFHSFSYRNYLDYRDADHGMSGMALFDLLGVSMTGIGEPELAFGMVVTHNYFEVVGARPALGRFFLPEEDETPGTHLVAVLGHSTWVNRFGGDPAIVGRTVNLNRRSFTVVGVAQEGFRGHHAILDVGVYIPTNASTAVREIDLDSRGSTWLEGIGRLKPGVAIPQVEATLNTIATNIEAEFPQENLDAGVDVRRYATLHAGAVGPVRGFTALLFALSGVILLIASINVGGMLLARAVRRGREMAVRLAVGARRMRLVRQLLTESVILFLLGGGAGVLITVYVTELLNAFQLPVPVPLTYDFSPDLRALGFALALAFVTGVAFGMAPALHVTRPDLSTTLKDEVGTARRSRLRSGLVVAQVAGSALLLVGAGLFLRALTRADAIELGFEPQGIHALGIDLQIHNYTEDEAKTFYERLSARVGAVPGVESFGLIDVVPLTLENQTRHFSIEGREPVEGEGQFETDFAIITPGYFETVRLPLARGRAFRESDREGSPMVAILNETAARRAWPGEDPIGRRINFGSLTEPTEIEIVGVARDAKYRTMGEEGRNMIYLPYAQQPALLMTVLARVREGTNVAGPFREIVRGLDPDLPLELNTAYEDLIGISLLPNRVAALFSAVFGVLGLILASVGLYGVLSFTISQRTREIGIRMALGAEDRRVRTLVLLDGVKLAAIGLAIGFAVAIAVTRLLRGLLHGLSPTDPITFAGIAVLLIGVALLASYVPALRATRTNPVEALRSE